MGDARQRPLRRHLPFVNNVRATDAKIGHLENRYTLKSEFGSNIRCSKGYLSQILANFATKLISIWPSFKIHILISRKNIIAENANYWYRVFD